ncbi:hypothetical protein U0070_017887, partial [Myodes glareolus]
MNSRLHWTLLGVQEDPSLDCEDSSRLKVKMEENKSHFHLVLLGKLTFKLLQIQHNPLQRQLPLLYVEEIDILKDDCQWNGESCSFRTAKEEGGFTLESATMIEYYYLKQRVPDKELNPGKKMWEQIQRSAFDDDKCVATYRGGPLNVKRK